MVDTKIFVWAFSCHALRIDDAVSDIAELISSVVQGSGIGPVMFIAYINELIYTPWNSLA